MAARRAAREAALAEQSSLSAEAQRKVDLLNRQILALREQLASLQEILDAVVATFPELGEEILDENGELDRYIHLFVDGRSSKFLDEGLATAVDGSQSIEFFPAVAGG